MKQHQSYRSIASAIGLATVLGLCGCLMAAPPSRGLDALTGKTGDHDVEAELAAHGMSGLLDRLFQVDQTPQSERDNLRFFVAKHRLGTDPHLSNQQKMDLTRDMAVGLKEALPKLHRDPIAEAQMGFELTRDVIYPSISTYEYWGDDDGSIRARVKPAVEGCIELYKQLSVDAAKAADDIANKMHGNGPEIDKLEKDFEDMTNLGVSADYTRWVLNYDLAVCTDSTDPSRRQMCLDAIEKIKQYDDPEQGIQADVRLMIGKLYMAAGDYDAANQKYDSVTGSDVKTPAGPYVVFDSKFFKALSEFYQQNASGAAEALESADQVQQTYPTGSPEEQGKQRVAAARVDLLRYRILNLQADQATDPKDKDRINQQAMNALQGLLAKFPGFQGVILQQMMSKMPATPDFKSLNPILLRALVEKGDQEIKKNIDLPLDKLDKPAIEKALGAALEYISRAGQPLIDKDSVQQYAGSIGWFLEKLGRDEEAANAYLDYADKFPGAKDAKWSLDETRVEMVKMLKSADAKQMDAAHALEDRFFPIAITKFHQNEFAYQYASRLDAANKWLDAIKYYRMVKDPAQQLNVEYNIQACLENLIKKDNNVSADDKTEFKKEVDKLIPELKTKSKDAMNAATDAKQKDAYRQIYLYEVRLGLDLPMEPDVKLTALNEYEALIKGTPEEKDSHFWIYKQRLDVYRKKGDMAHSLDILKKMLDESQGKFGSALIAEVMNSLRDQINQEQDPVKKLAVAHDLVYFARWNMQFADDPKSSGYDKRYEFHRYYFYTKRITAQLELDAAIRKATLKEALDGYTELLKPEWQELYWKDATTNPKFVTDKQTDPVVMLGLGAIAFEVGEWETVRQQFGPLVKHLLQEDTEQYWEGLYKWTAAEWEIGKDPKGSVTKEDAIKDLKTTWAIWHQNIGANFEWHDKFMALIQVEDPSILNPATAQTTPATTQPTSQPSRT